MALQRTNLVIRASPLPPDFRGTPQDLYEAMVRRMSILSPVGTNFFVVGDTEPSSNVGPWLRLVSGGAQWWVFSDTEGRYVPLDISASETPFAFVGPNDPGTPGADDPLLWVRTNENRIAGIFGWNGEAWVASGNVPNSGPTEDRPPAPVNLEEYFDTDINVLLRFERGAWRTAAGSPGDVKAVVHTTLEEAMRYNPGWTYLGLNDQDQRGRFVAMAAKDPGATPASSFVVGSGITARFAGETFGSETVTLGDGEIPQHTHLIGHATALNSDNNILIHRVDNGDEIAIPAPLPPNHFQVNGEGGTNGTKSGTAGTGPTGTMLVTSVQLSESNAPAYTTPAEPHSNTPQALALWHLVKS